MREITIIKQCNRFANGYFFHWKFDIANRIIVNLFKKMYEIRLRSNLKGFFSNRRLYKYLSTGRHADLVVWPPLHHP